MRTAEAVNLVAGARTKLVVRQPFFGSMLLHLRNRPVEGSEAKEVWPGTPTAAMALEEIEGKLRPVLLYSPDFVGGITKDQLLGLLCHEILHLAMRHHWRRGNRDLFLWNMACDYVVNLIVTEAGIALPPDGLVDQKYTDWSAEAVYDDLVKKRSGAPKFVHAMGNLKIVGKGGGGGESPTVAIECSDPRMERLAEEWGRNFVKAVMAGKMAGKCPSGAQRLVDNLLTPKIPWECVVEQYMDQVLYDDYDDSRYDRRFLANVAVVGPLGQETFDNALYFPTLYSEAAKVVFVADASGSIGEEDLKKAMTEIVNLSRTRNVSSVRIMSHDTKIHLDVTLGKGDPMPKGLPGGGGTDFRPVFNLLSRDPEPPKLVVYMSDLYGTFPSEPPPYPVLWLVVNNASPGVPFGNVIRYDHE